MHLIMCAQRNLCATGKKLCAAPNIRTPQVFCFGRPPTTHSMPLSPPYLLFFLTFHTPPTHPRTHEMHTRFSQLSLPCRRHAQTALAIKGPLASSSSTASTAPPAQLFLPIRRLSLRGRSSSPPLDRQALPKSSGVQP